MASAAAATTKRARAGGGSGRDRLSALPDELLHRVLSFLPAQEVVRTTVLSRRWTDLWRLVPRIDLDFLDFRMDSGSDDHWGGRLKRMNDFANNLLMLHRAPGLDAFRLKALFEGRDGTQHIDRWVRRAMKDNPLVLEVSVDELHAIGSISYQLPHLAFSPRRRLQRLQLSGMSLDLSFAEHLHRWWPDLEDLDLRHCCIGFSGIESSKLKYLAVNDCRNQSADVFVIRAPHLACLRLDIPFSLDGGNPLVRASISLKRNALSPKNEAMLLSRLFSVANFELQGFQAMVVLDEEFNEVPIFENLTTLSLESCFDDLSKCDLRKFKALARFLQKFPNLEKLTLKHFKVEPVVESGDFPILQNLRTLFLHMCDVNDNFGLLGRCLRNSPNLEKFTIWYCQLPDGFSGREGNATYSLSRNQQVRIQCPELKSTEIIGCRNRADVPELLRFLLDIDTPKNTITFSKN